jgi:NAD(P)H-dependent FMN reductase
MPRLSSRLTETSIHGSTHMSTDLNSQRLLIVSGSARAGGLTRTVLQLVDAIARRKGLQTEFTCARQLRLPLYGLDEDGSNALQWRQSVKSCAGVIFGSPEYHGSFSGAFKNLLDHLDFEHIEGKPVGLVAVGGGPKSGIASLNAMRLSLRALHVPVVVEQAAAWEGDFDATTKRPNAELLRHLTGVVDGVAREFAKCSVPV